MRLCQLWKPFAFALKCISGLALKKKTTTTFTRSIKLIHCFYLYPSLLSQRNGECEDPAAATSLAPTAFVKALTFTAAAKVAEEHWALRDLDRGVLKRSELLLFKRPEEREDVRKRGKV